MSTGGPGPVIPNFGEGSSCEVRNGAFCWGWVHDHWGDTLQPALLQHLERGIAPARRFDAPRGGRELEVGEMSAGEVVCEVGGRETDAFAGALHGPR